LVRNQGEEAGQGNEKCRCITKFTGGDLAYANGRSWERWLDWIEVYADHAVSEDGYSIPFVVAIGNHEVNGGYGKTPKEAPMFYNFFPFPQN